jgi:gliding motility-associated-like protein
MNWNDTKHYGIWGLPTFIQSYFKTFWFSVENECIGDVIVFTPNSIDNISLIEWNFGNPASGNENTSTLFDPVHIYLSPGEYTVTAKFYYLNTYQTYSKIVEIFEIPDIELGNDTTICIGDTAKFEIDEDFAFYTWNGQESLDPMFKTPDEGLVTLEVSNVCGSDIVEAYVYVQPLPKIDLGPDIKMKYQEYIFMDAGQHYSFLWSDGSKESYITPQYPGDYWVEVYDAFGCKASDTINVVPIPFAFYVPNAFSPNGDDVNESFEIFTSYDLNLKSGDGFDFDFDFEFHIYNRWGQEVFFTRNFGEFWDGTYNNVPCTIEVYTWIMVVRMQEDNAFFSKATQLSGNVTLLR